jgi:integrase/recombinase XerD
MKTIPNAEWIARFDAYLQRRFPNRSTAKHYVSDMNVFARQHEGPFAAMTVQDIDAFVDRQHEQELSAATVKRRVATLKTFFDFLAEEEQDEDRPNPVSMRRHAGRQPKHLPRDLSDDQVQQLLESVNDSRDMAMISLMLYAGLRVGEVVGLCLEDITVPQDSQELVRLRVRGKGEKERMVYLDQAGYRSVQQYLEEQPLIEAGSRVFRNRRGKPITVAGVQNRISEYGQQSGVPVTCHRLRHTFARWMAESEMPVLALSRLLGHASIQTTQIYIDSADPQVRRSYEAAMGQSSTSTETITVHESLPAIDVRGAATVIREVPATLEAEDWMPEWPAWLREGCLGWVQRQWYQWKPTQRRSTAGTRLRELRIFWRWQFTQRSYHSWSDLSRADIDAFVDAQLARGLLSKTIKRHLATLYQVLQYLVDQGQLTEIPSRPRLTLPDPLPRHLKPAEVLALEQYVELQETTMQDTNWLDIALYYLLTHSGLRTCEALDLQVKDLDLPARRIRVRQGKGNKDRIVYTTRRAARALHRYLQTVPHAADDLVLSLKDRPLSDSALRSRLARFCQAAGVENVSPRRLRHTYATLLLNNGVSLDGLRRLMGHDNLDTTLIYARIADTTLERQYRSAIEHIPNDPDHSV